MAAAGKKYSYKDYTVAWICALPLELAAAKAMLDETHPSLPAKINDDNQYTLGRIHAHNVVISCLPSGVYGTTSATSVATQMRSSFDSIRFFLMVGIGGGAPSKNNDIRLGDVVISRPTRDLGGVIQYDFGKAISGGRFQRIGVLNKPPQVLLSAISSMQSTDMLTPNRISSLITDMTTRDHKLGKTFAHPGQNQDLLFDHEYDHPESEATCKNCDQKWLINRPSRAIQEPFIHYGLIASGNQVMKDSRIRDKIVQELGVLCFEMEAAGLMDNFPCLVVRGICDYSDSHKNKQWQNYAAAVAAAYTKELLSVVHSTQVSDTPPVDFDVSFSTGATPYRIKPPTEVMLHQNIDERLLRRISSYDQEKMHRKLSEKRVIGTTQWFLNHPDFTAWLTDEEAFSLWCSGKIGSGKTMIATAVVEAVKYRFSKANSPVVFFYCDYEHSDGLDVSYIISSFIKQLCEFLYRTSGRYPGEIMQDLKKFFGPRRIQPDFDDLQDIFTKMFYFMPGTTYIVDGIDALSEVHAKRLLKLIQRLFCSRDASMQSRILLLSRDQIPGYINLDTFIPGIRRISTAQNIMQDIETYIDTSIVDKMMRRKLTDDGDLLEEIKKILLRESSDMFLWVYLQLEILWDTCRTDAEIRSALATLPKDIEETYSRCIGRIDFQDKWALKVLKWVSFANRPLHIEELREAIAFDCTDTEWNADKKPQSQFTVGCCANLVVMDLTDYCVRFAHSSVKQYLEEDRKKITEERCTPGYPTDANGDLECGEYCVSYLCFSDFNLQLVKNPLEQTSVVVPAPLSIAKSVSATGTKFSKLFFPQLRGQKNSFPISFRRIHTPAVPNRKQYKFLDYVIENWALHTKQISCTSEAWENFEQLATCFNETWNFHPWAPGGRSKDSQLHGLYGWAVKEQHKPFLSIIQDAGPSLRHVCDLPLVDEGLPALHIASKLGYIDIIEILVKFCNVNNLGQDGCAPLHYAANKGHTEATQLLLLQKGIRVDINSESQCTPLWLAASNGHDDVMSLLIEKRASIEVKDSVTRRTPLSCATSNGHYTTVRLLLEKGARMESRDAGNHTPLSLAIANRNKEMINLLLSNGAKLDSKDYASQPLLQWATENSFEALLILLIDKRTNDENKELASLAAKNGYEVVLKLLLARGKQHNLQELLFLAAENGREAVVRLLLENGVTRYAPAGLESPLRLAAENGHESVVQLLIASGASYDTQVLLLIAAENGHDAVIQFLLAKSTNNESRELLSLAIRNGYDTIMKSLLGKVPNYDSQELLSLAEENRHEKTVNVLLENITDYGHPELLLWAAENYLIITVRLLLEKGTDPNTKDRQGATPLYWAAGSGHAAVVELLLEKGADPNAKKANNNWTPLFWAASNGQMAIARLLLENGADPDVTAHNGQNVLLVAASNGHKEVVQLLIEKGANLGFRGPDGQSALFLAISNGHEATVNVLLEGGAEWESPVLDGLTLLVYAIKKGNGAIISLLLEKGARLDVETTDFLPLLLEALEKGHKALIHALLSDIKYLHTEDEKEFPLLSKAAGYGYEDVTNILLSKGANPNNEDYEKKTPLHYAAMKGHEAVTSLLLQNNANPNAEDSRKYTPLHYAAKHNAAITELLLDNGANPHSRNNDQQVSLHCAAQGNLGTVMELLLGSGVDPNAKDSDEQTPLHYAFQNRYDAGIQLLLENGADPNVKDSDEQMPLHYALKNRYDAGVQLLFENGADANAKDSVKQTPLHHALQNRYEAGIKLLLKNGADPNAKDSYEQTPLHYAVQKLYKAGIKLLLENGADADAKDSEEQTPLHHALQNRYEAGIKLLLDNGADPNAKDSSEQTPLYYALQKYHEPGMQLLIENGANLNAAFGSRAETALHSATELGSRELMQLLLENGADPNAGDYFQQSPLHYIVSNHSISRAMREAAKLLLQYGARADIVDCEGVSPISLATTLGHAYIVGLFGREEAVRKASVIKESSSM